VSVTDRRRPQRSSWLPPVPFTAVRFVASYDGRLLTVANKRSEVSGTCGSLFYHPTIELFHYLL